MDLFFGHGGAWFSVPAFLGTFFFLLRLGLMFVGGDGDVDADFDADFHGDIDTHGDASVHGQGDSSSAFKVLSVQSVGAFMMGFGWGGLGGLKGAGWDPTSSLILGLVVGSGMVWVLGKLLETVYGFQSSGTVLIDWALDAEGSVYIAIPPHKEGRGRVRLVIGDRQRYYDAVTDDEGIESRSRVRVIAVNDDNTVTVTRHDDLRDLKGE